MSRVVGIHYDEWTDRMSKFKLEDGTVVDFDRAYNMVECGELPDLMVGTARDGSRTIHSKRGIPDYSLKDQPTF